MDYNVKSKIIDAQHLPIFFREEMLLLLQPHNMLVESAPVGKSAYPFLKALAGSFGALIQHRLQRSRESKAGYFIECFLFTVSPNKTLRFCQYFFSTLIQKM